MSKTSQTPRTSLPSSNPSTLEELRHHAQSLIDVVNDLDSALDAYDSDHNALDLGMSLNYFHSIAFNAGIALKSSLESFSMQFYKDIPTNP